MKIKSYSKINLTLRVLKQLKNGLHDIETNSTLINLYDELTLKKNYKDQVIFKGKFSKKVNSKKNSVIDTIQLLRKYNLIKNFYKITVKKNIPVYAGLGGGTSNSVTIFKYFLKRKIKKNIINSFEKKIGSDFRLFLNNNSFQKKFKKVFKVKNKVNSFLVIVFPNINCKTKEIYKMVKYFSPSSGGQYLKKINKKNFIKILQKDRNDLQNLVERKYSKISLLIKNINLQKGCIFSRMSGSGSVCYGVFNSKKTALLAITNLKRKYPKYWCVISKTI